MKIKLLKRIRKEFSINYYPNGFKRIDPSFRSNIIALAEDYGPNTYTLERNGSILSVLDLSKNPCDKTPEVIFNDLRNLLEFHIRDIYGHYGTRRIKKLKQQQKPNKLWYKSI